MRTMYLTGTVRYTQHWLLMAAIIIAYSPKTHPSNSHSCSCSSCAHRRDVGNVLEASRRQARSLQHATARHNRQHGLTRDTQGLHPVMQCTWCDVCDGDTAKINTKLHIIHYIYTQTKNNIRLKYKTCATLHMMGGYSKARTVRSVEFDDFNEM